MEKFVLTCCSTADLPEDFYLKRDVHYTCFHFIIDNISYDDDLGKSMSYEEFYNRMKNGAMPTTSQVNVDEFIRFFEPYLQAGKDILHVSLSSGISGAYNSANIAKETLEEQYPERTIKILDSLGASSGYGLFMEYLADKRDEGLSLLACYEWGEKARQHFHHWFLSSDLTAYLRGGRISKTSATLGTLLGICPLMSMNDLGQLIPREKVRTKKKALHEIVERMATHAQDGLSYSGKCFISESACYEDARFVADLVEQKFKNLQGKVVINSIGTVIGSHTGPGTVALFFVGDARER